MIAKSKKSKYKLTLPFTLHMVTYTIQQYRTFYGLEHAQLSRLQEVCPCWNRWPPKSWHTLYIKGMLYTRKDQSVFSNKAIQTESFTQRVLQMPSFFESFYCHCPFPNSCSWCVGRCRSQQIKQGIHLRIHFRGPENMFKSYLASSRPWDSCKTNPW